MYALPQLNYFWISYLQIWLLFNFTAKDFFSGFDSLDKRVNSVSFRYPTSENFDTTDLSWKCQLSMCVWQVCHYITEAKPAEKNLATQSLNMVS